MAKLLSYAPYYRSSWALVVGINAYQHMAPLNSAVKDAHDTASLLMGYHSFPPHQVILLTDEMATRDNILAVFDAIITPASVTPDDRVLVFFAGHGLTRHTHDGGRIGYIAPVDAQVNAWRTQIEMQELIDQAMFLPAKHILFVMDACYSGLSLRKTQGSAPVTDHFLTHRAVQVITAGREDEQVIDGGDPDGNSLFTGHFLDGLSGRALTASRLMTASDVMRYINRNMTVDNAVGQTPQYGWVEGEGDFVFSLPQGVSLPPRLEVTLRQGISEARLMALQELAEIAAGRDPDLSALATQRLLDVAESDPDLRVAQTALRLLGIERNTLPPPVSTVETHEIAAISLRAVAETIPDRSHSQRLWRYAFAALIMAAIVCAGSLAASGIAVWRGRIVAGQSARSEWLTPDHSETPGASMGGEASATPSLVAEASETGTEPASTSVITPTPTPDLSENPGLLFADDFSILNDAWEPGPNDSRARRIIDNGQMAFTVEGAYGLWLARPRDLVVDDGAVSVDVMLLAGPPDASYGLVFRQIDLDNYYYYRVSLDGTFALLVQDGGAVRYLVRPASLKAIPGANETHRLGMEFTGSSLTLLYDSEVIAAIHDFKYASGQVGLAVQTLKQTPVDVVFDNFAVYGP